MAAPLDPETSPAVRRLRKLELQQQLKALEASRATAVSLLDKQHVAEEIEAVRRDMAAC